MTPTEPAKRKCLLGRKNFNLQVMSNAARSLSIYHFITVIPFLNVEFCESGEWN